MNSVGAQRSAQKLYAVYLARVIKIKAVQCHQAAVTDDYNTQFLFFEAGCRPKLRGHFQWSLDSPEEDLPGAPPGRRTIDPKPISPPMQLAWDAAVAAFKEFIEAIKKGELIANGMHAATGVRQDLDPAEWTREGLILDVRNGDLFEGWLRQACAAQRGRLDSLAQQRPYAMVDHHAASGYSRTKAWKNRLGRVVERGRSSAGKGSTPERESLRTRVRNAD